MEEGKKVVPPKTHHPNEWEIDNLPNRLTLLRVVMIPIIIFSLYFTTKNEKLDASTISNLNWIAAWTFVLASITDFFDGYIARQRNIVTIFGSFLDPIADKFLVISSLIMLLALERLHVLMVLVLVLREMYITALRLLAMEKGLSVPVGALGKWKTATQMIGIPMLMAHANPFGIPMIAIGQWAMILASVFSLYSALEYSLGLIKKIQKIRKEKKLEKKMRKEDGEIHD